MLTNRLLLCFVTLLLAFSCAYALNDMPQLFLMGGPNGSCFGAMIESLDFNHDGYDDLVVLSSNYGVVNPETPARGKVYIYFGGPNFGSSPFTSISLQGDYPNGAQRRITGISNVGDVNSDGYDDLLIVDKMPDAPGNSRFLYYFGGTVDLATPDRIEYQLPNEEFHSFETLGDVDNDGYDDVGIAYSYNEEFHFDIMWGGSFIRQNILAGTGYHPSYGSIIGIGDVDNDGFDDFNIGYVVGGEIGQYTSDQRIYYGNQMRDFSNFQYLIQCPSRGIWHCVSLGDMNGDSFDDFFGYATSEGLMIWYGSNNITSDIHDVVLFQHLGMYQSIRKIKSADFNGDGYSDVLATLYDSGCFFVWLGSTSMNGLVDFQMQGYFPGFGSSLAAGDFNGDGFDDIAVSAPSTSDIEEAIYYPGFVFVFAGNPGLVATNDPLVPPLAETINMQIGPNPVRSDGNIKISVNGADKYAGMPLSVEVYNIKGQAVHQSEISREYTMGDITGLCLSGLPSGVYICRAKIGNQSVSKKFTVFN